MQRRQMNMRLSETERAALDRYAAHEQLAPAVAARSLVLKALAERSYLDAARREGERRLRKGPGR